MRHCIILSPSFGTKQMIYRPRNASNSPILEESQRFMSPDADETLDRQCLQRPQRLEDAPDPAGHLSRRVDVVRLRVLCEPLLFQREHLVERTSKQTKHLHLGWINMSSFKSSLEKSNYDRNKSSANLRHGVELHHGGGERLSEGPQ